MALAYDVTSIRNAMLDTITTRAGNAALLRVYDSTGTGRPSTGGAITTQVLLAELTCGTPFAAAASSGVLTLGAITQDSSANNTGTATWFRIVKSDGTSFVMDGNVGTSGSDLNLTTTSIVATQPVSVTSFVITEANP
mgnify:CR=1 FL=1|tara:strand:- start:824 stop:1237 length:414 start_codon:yes stop_codon:yes gene_type:complete